MTNRKVNVMHVIDNLDIGGAQEVVCTLVKYLQLDGCRPVVCTFGDGHLRQEIERSGIPVEELPARRYSILALPLFIIDMIRIWKSMARLIKKHNVDVLQTHILGSLDFLLLVLRYTTPLQVVLWTFHNERFELTKSRLPGNHWLLSPKKLVHRFFYRLTGSLINGIVAVSDDVRNAILRTIGPIGSKVTVICNGVDTIKHQQTTDNEKTFIREQLGLGVNTRLIALVATLKEQKGHRYLIKAMASIVPRHADVHAIFVGNGPLKESLELQVETLNIEEHVHFLGARHDVPRILAGSDLFVLPSNWEGLSMALLEAMASSLPVVASEVSGTVEVIVPNESGFLVPPGDTQRLVQAIEQLLNDSLLAHAMGKAAKKRVAEKFSAYKQANEHVALYQKLMG